jgi:hypothetical protein
MRESTLLVSSSASGFQGAKQSVEKCAKFAKMALYIHPCGPVTEKAGLEVIRRWFDVAHHRYYRVVVTWSVKHRAVEARGVSISKV